MTKEQIDSLLSAGKFQKQTGEMEFIETHISWVFLGDAFVYKIKKPVQYSFLDFSTLELRKYYCHREIELNKRMTKNVYLDVLPVRKWKEQIIVGGEDGMIIDYAVKMNKLDTEKQMDKLLTQNLVKESDIKNLAEKIASFHKNTTIIYEKDSSDIREKFNDLAAEKEFIKEQLGISFGDIVGNAIKFSDKFMNKNKGLIENRLQEGFCRDGHGDLHSRNIFLLPEPVPFDCIEFNDDFRQTDVLNEVAFLCMDMDAYDHPALSEMFLKYYNEFFPAMKTDREYQLFIYYKSYRANIRAKVNAMRAKSAATNQEKANVLMASEKYLCLMKSYLKELDNKF